MAKWLKMALTASLVSALLSVTAGCGGGGGRGRGTECGTSGAHSHTGDDGLCYCDTGYDWMNPDDKNDNRCKSKTAADILAPPDADVADDVPVGGDSMPDQQIEAVVPDECLVGIPCVVDSDCEAGQHCNTKLSPPECEKLYCGAQDSVCDEDAVCAPGLFCIYGKCVPSIPAPECEAARASFEKCGGDVVGTWKLVSACLSLDSCFFEGGILTNVCSLECADTTPAQVLYSNASITFKENGTVEAAIPTMEVNCSVHAELPCYGGPGQTCDDYAAFLSQIGVKEWVCQTAADGCDCSKHQVVTPTAEEPLLPADEYDTSGNNFYLYVSGHRADGTFCRQGNLLVIEFACEVWVLSL